MALIQDFGAFPNQRIIAQDQGFSVYSFSRIFLLLENPNNNYDFGDIAVGESSSNITFTIKNNGSGILKLTNDYNTIDLVSGKTNMFSIYDSLTLTKIKQSETTIFIITFRPLSNGYKKATVVIENNDPKARNFTFTISGTGISPEISLKKNIVSYISNVIEYDFGNVAIYNSFEQVVFVIENNGNSVLILADYPNSIKISGLNASEFSIYTNSTSPIIKPNDNTSFTINFDPVYFGPKIATITIKIMILMKIPLF